MIDKLIILNKEELEKKIAEIEKDYFKTKQKEGFEEDTQFLDGARTYLKYVYNDISKPLKPYIEEAFEAGRDNVIYRENESGYESLEGHLKQIKW